MISEENPNPLNVGRTFLCVIDESKEMWPALRFACLRALHSGGQIALLCITRPAEFQHWNSVSEAMDEERRIEAEETLQVVASLVKHITGAAPAMHIRKGDAVTALASVLSEESDIAEVVLGAGYGPEGPGPLVSKLTQKMIGQFSIPVSIVPGNLTDDQIDAIA